MSTESVVGSAVPQAQRREISVLVVNVLRFFPRAGLPRNPLGQPGLLLGTGLEDVRTSRPGRKVRQLLGGQEEHQI